MGALGDELELNSDFAAFYERHVAMVAAYLGRRVLRPDLVFDLVAETFARALEHRDQYDARRGPAVAWLLGIARNLVADAARRGRVASEARRRLGMTPVALDDEALERIELRASVNLNLHSLLAELPASQREAVVRRVLADESYAVIAERIGCSEQVVRQRVSRGLATLRRESGIP
jgi:RNA polymerase sigma factor (sigma-70 family)